MMFFQESFEDILNKLHKDNNNLLDLIINDFSRYIEKVK